MCFHLRLAVGGRGESGPRKVAAGGFPRRKMAIEIFPRLGILEITEKSNISVSRLIAGSETFTMGQITC